MGRLWDHHLYLGWGEWDHHLYLGWGEWDHHLYLGWGEWVYHLYLGWGEWDYHLYLGWGGVGPSFVPRMGRVGPSLAPRWLMLATLGRELGLQIHHFCAVQPTSRVLCTLQYSCNVFVQRLQLGAAGQASVAREHTPVKVLQQSTTDTSSLPCTNVRMTCTINCHPLACTP